MTRETEYVLLEKMTAGDFACNVKRMRRAGHSKNRKALLDHADALEEYGRTELLPLSERLKFLRSYAGGSAVSIVRRCGRARRGRDSFDRTPIWLPARHAARRADQRPRWWAGDALGRRARRTQWGCAMKTHRAGNYRSTIYSVARRSLAAGADPAGTIEIWRNGRLSMSGNIGKCAKLMVTGNSHGALTKWKPVSTRAGVRPRTAETDARVP